MIFYTSYIVPRNELKNVGKVETFYFFFAAIFDSQNFVKLY